MSALNWQKSSYSSESINCVYLAMAPGRSVKLRESDHPNVIITTTPDALRALIGSLQTGDFDHLTA